MFQRDYILRQIQELIQVIARIMGLRIEGNYEEARSHIAQALKSIWNIHSDEILGLQENELLALCQVNGVFHTDFALALADLLSEDGHIHREQQSSEMALQSFKQAFVIYELILSHSNATPYDIYDRISRLEELMHTIGTEVPPISDENA